MSKPKHGRELVLSAVSVVPGRVRHSAAAAAEVRELVESMMVRSDFLATAPFSWVGIVFRYGVESRESPDYGKIDPDDGELPVTIELDINDLERASKENVVRQFLDATLRTLIDIGRRYDLPTADLEANRPGGFEDSVR